MRLLPVLVVLAATVAHAQAVRPAPATGPLIHQQPPSYPTQVHAPAGAGASHGGLAAPRPVPVPDSPNKRLLPPTKEHGLWAADGAPVAQERRQLWGVVIPLPAGDVAHRAEKVAWWCAVEMDDVATKILLHSTVIDYPDDIRRCIVATLQHHCVVGEAALSKRKRARGEELDRERDRALAALDPHTAALQARWCAGVSLNDEQKWALGAIRRTWDVAVKKGEAQ